MRRMPPALPGRGSRGRGRWAAAFGVREANTKRGVARAGGARALPGRGRAAPSAAWVIDLVRDVPWCGLRQGGPAEVAHHARGGAEAHLVILDRDPAKPWSAKIYRRVETHADRRVSVWGM